MPVVNERLTAERVLALIGANWPHQEVSMHKGIPSEEEAELPTINNTPSDELTFLQKKDRYTRPCPKGVDPSLMRMYKKSQVRTPLLWHATEVRSTSWHKMSDIDGEPFDSLQKLATSMGVNVVTYRIGTTAESNTAECQQKLESCLCEGNWLFIIEKGTPSFDLYRYIGRKLVTLVPSALKYPNRERFRLWIKVETGKDEVIDLNRNINPYFPKIFTLNAIMCTNRVHVSEKGTERKIVRPKITDPYGLPVGVNYFKHQNEKRNLRLASGQDSDAESDDEVTVNVNSSGSSGPWFLRASDHAKSCLAYDENFIPTLQDTLESK